MVDLSRGCGNPIAYANLHEGEVIVDLGCGAGIDVILAARKVGPGSKVIGIDFSSEMIEQAERAVVDAGLEGADIRLMVGAIENTGLQGEFADVVISNCVINLCPDKDAVYREAFRILKPGGRIAVSDILLSEHLASDVESKLRTNWSGCLGGAEVEEDYWRIIEFAGFDGLSIVSRHVLSPDELFVIACCPGEDFSNAPPPDILTAALGKAESVKFRAQKGETMGKVHKSSWTYRGEPVPFVPLEFNFRIGMSYFRSRMSHKPWPTRPMYAHAIKRAPDLESATIKVENINGPVLLTGGGADGVWPSDEMAKAMGKRLTSRDRNFKDVVLTYPDAGHQIASPYTSTSINYLTIGGGFIELLGGTPKANAMASEDSFPKINEFLAGALGVV